MAELTLADCQHSAETALRQAARDRPLQLRPPDAGLVQAVNDAVAAAHKLGKQQADAELRRSLAAAWGGWLDLLLQNQELLTDLKYAEPELCARLLAALGSRKASHA